MSAYTRILAQRAKKNASASVLHTFSVSDVILGFVMTEKGYNPAEGSAAKTYVFSINTLANKNDVKQTISSLYNVSVESVRIVVVPKKHRANRGLVRKSYKKAYVTLHPGDEILFSEQ